MAGFRSRAGSVPIEFALVLPVTMTLMIGVFEVSWLIRAEMKLGHVADMLAKIVAQQGAGVTAGPAGSLTDFCNGAGYALAPFATSPLAASIASVSTSTQNGTNSTALDWESAASCATAAARLGGNRAVAMASSAGLVPKNGDSVVIVSAQYAYQAPLHLLLPSSYALSRTVYVRPRGSRSISCANCDGAS